MGEKKWMKRRKGVVWLCIGLMIFSVLGSSVDVHAAKKQDASLGPLHVEGTTLCDKDGNVVQLRGVSTHGLSWFPQYVNDACFKELHDKWGANVVRLAMYTAEYNGYCVSDTANRKALKKLVKKGVKLAKSFFQTMSKEFADYDNVIYELCNEPNGGTDWATIKSYATSVIKTIRANDKDAVIIVGTPTWSQEVDKAAASPIKDDNVMYALHFYADTHRDFLRERAEAVLKMGLPIFVSEFGICDASGNGNLNKDEAKKWMSLLDRYQVSYVAWNLANKNEASSLIASSCSKTSGWSRNDLSESGKWLYDLLRKKSGKSR